MATVDGADSKWNNSDNLYVGNSGSGSLAITDGGAVSNNTAYIGFASSSSGTVTVDGLGSTWTNTGNLYVGYNGSGSLAITNGSAVSVAGTTSIGSNGTGTIDFGANGGTLTTALILASSSQLVGTGTVNAVGLVSDVNLQFDLTTNQIATAVLNSLPGQNITMSLDMSVAARNGLLGLGYQGKGSLTIKEGIEIASTTGYLGYNSGSNGTATVDGAGSKWTNSGDLYVGNSGSGSLAITNGGAAENTYGQIGYNAGSSGVVTVSDALRT